MSETKLNMFVLEYVNSIYTHTATHTKPHPAMLLQQRWCVKDLDTNLVGGMRECVFFVYECNRLVAVFVVGSIDLFVVWIMRDRIICLLCLSCMYIYICIYAIAIASPIAAHSSSRHINSSPNAMATIVVSPYICIRQRPPARSTIKLSITDQTPIPFHPYDGVSKSLPML